MKKFFTVMLLAVGIIFGSFATTEAYDEYKVNIYAYSENGKDYRVTKILHADTRFVVAVFAYKDSKPLIEALIFNYFYDDDAKKFYYEIEDPDGNIMESGYLDSSRKNKVASVFKVVQDVYQRHK